MKVVVIVRYLYDLKSSDLALRNHLSEILVNQLRLQSSLSDPYFWFKAATYKSRNEYYSYIIVYVNDFIIVDKDPQNYMAILENKYTVIPYSIGEPKVYLGANVGKLLYGNSSYDWTMISGLYVEEAIKNVKKRLKEYGMEYNKKLFDVKYSPNNPFASVDHRLELDKCMKYKENQVSFYLLGHNL